MEIFFAILKTLGGLAMFLYGMRIMGNSLKESSSGTLKVVMEKVTNNPLKAFLLGFLFTGIIQSSTATIVITSGLVAAGIIKFEHSIGVIVGANVGTTITGQIIRLLDIDGSGNSVLQFFKPDTLAPVALIIGIIILMAVSSKSSTNVGTIIIGFGILFYGLILMTQSVDAFKDDLGILFVKLGDKPILGYLTGATVAFILQSSSASVGILQALSMAGGLPFNSVYIILCGIYLGDCVTTAIVCSIGAKADAKRVGFVNIVFNFFKTLLVIVGVLAIKSFGLIDTLWNSSLSSGGIADANTIFNLACALILLPFVGLFGKLSKVIIKDDTTSSSKYSNEVEVLNPTFFATPALAFRSCYDTLLNMFNIATENVNLALDLITNYNSKSFDYMVDQEKKLDYITDRLSSYLVDLSKHITGTYHISILDQYYKLTNEFERLGDQAVNIGEVAKGISENNVAFTEKALEELKVLRQLQDEILEYTRLAFEKRDIDAARKIEPLEEVMDDLINALHDNHLNRLRENSCSIIAGTFFLDALSSIEKISDTCSNIGVATVARVDKSVAKQAHKYISQLHQGKNMAYNEMYHEMHDIYFDKLPINVESDVNQQSLFANE